MLPSDGVSLQRVIDATRRLDELGTARLIAQAAELVHKAQTGGQPLGTLSVDAVVVLPSGDVKLAPGTAAVRGYVAPERLRGASGDRRSDVFALGVILWEALAHTRLFTGDDDAVTRAVLAGGVTAPSEHNANIPAELDAICKRALAAEPVDRYQSAKVMAAEIAAVLDDAGYPETNERIASYLATELAPAPVLVPQPPVLPVTDAPSRPANQTIHGMAPLRDEPAKPAPSLATAPPTQTLQGVMPRKELDAALAKLAADGARAKTPTSPGQGPGTLPAWATGRAAADAEAPAPAAPTVLTSAGSGPVDARPTNKTAIMGSVPSSEPLPASEPARKKRDSLAERLAALNGVPAVPGLPAVPPGADPAIVAAAVDAAPVAPVTTPASAPSAPPSAPTVVPPTIANAETISTPALADAAPPPAVTAPLAAEVAPAVTAPLAAAAPIATAVEPSAPTAHPAAVVALPRARAPSEAGGKVDPLHGWGWKDGHETAGDLDDDYYDDEGKTAKKRLVYAIGGAAAAVLVIVVAALAFGGSSGDKPAAEKPPATAAGSVDWRAPVEPAPSAAAEPPATDPASAQPPPTEPAAGSADVAAVEPTVEPAPPAPPAPAPEPTKPAPPAPAKVAKPEPAKPEPAKPEPAKPEPAKPEPVKPAKPEPAKLAKAEPAKAREPIPVAKAVAKPARTVDPFAVPSASRKVDKKREAPKPIDPYAATPEPKKAVDPNAAYKAGIQQFARGDANGALSTFKASLAANPGFAPTWRGIGMVYEKLGKKSQAKTAFRKYLQLSPAAGDAAQIRERMERL